jgi:hypothetical protein
VVTVTGYSPPFGPLAVPGRGRAAAALPGHAPGGCPADGCRDRRRVRARAPGTLGRFAAEVRDPITGVLEVGVAGKITRQDDGACLVTETARDQRREDGWMRAVDRGEDRLADARQGCRRAGR